VGGQAAADGSKVNRHTNITLSVIPAVTLLLVSRVRTQIRADLRIKMAVLSPDAQPVRYIRAKVGGRAVVTSLDRGPVSHQLPKTDYLVLTRQVSHDW
jgi:hypothetical protein